MSVTAAAEAWAEATADAHASAVSSAVAGCGCLTQSVTDAFTDASLYLELVAEAASTATATACLDGMHAHSYFATTVVCLDLQAYLHVQWLRFQHVSAYSLRKTSGNTRASQYPETHSIIY